MASMLSPGWLDCPLQCSIRIIATLPGRTPGRETRAQREKRLLHYSTPARREVKHYSSRAGGGVARMRCIILPVESLDEPSSALSHDHSNVLGPDCEHDREHCRQAPRRVT